MIDYRIDLPEFATILNIHGPANLERITLRDQEIWAVGAHALNTQTTPPDLAAVPQSVRRAVDLVLRIAQVGTTDPEIWDAWRDMALQMSGELRWWKLNDSGKSGRQASKSENGGADTSRDANGAVRGDFAAVVDLAAATAADLVEAIREQAGDGFAYVERQDGVAGQVTHQLGTVTRDTLDPSAAEQRERFEAIAGKPRPSAADVKAMLETLAKNGAWLYGCETWQGDKGGRGIDGPGYSRMLDGAAAMIDRLGVHLLAMELERDELAGKLRKLAEAPTEPADIAELVQEARRIADHNRGPLETRTLALLIDKLVAALNDQVRQVRERTAERDAAVAAIGDEHMINDGLRAERDRMEVERDAARDVLSDARDDAPADIIGDALRMLTGLMLNGKDPGASAWSGLVSRMRWAMMQTEPQMAELRATIANLTRERDAARRHAESDRQNLAASVAPWLWVHDIATAPWVPADLRTEHWGHPTGRMAEAIVHWLREQLDQARTYDDQKRDHACTKARETWPGLATNNGWGQVVDAVADALGMRRAAK